MKSDRVSVVEEGGRGGTERGNVYREGSWKRVNSSFIMMIKSNTVKNLDVHVEPLTFIYLTHE